MNAIYARNELVGFDGGKLCISVDRISGGGPPTGPSLPDSHELLQACSWFQNALLLDVMTVGRVEKSPWKIVS
jgi:hypothetical protein